MLKRVLKKLRRRVKNALGGRTKLRSRIATLETKLDGLAIHVPTLLNMISSLRAALRQQMRLAEDVERLRGRTEELAGELVPRLASEVERLGGRTGELAGDLVPRLASDIERVRGRTEELADHLVPRLAGELGDKLRREIAGEHARIADLQELQSEFKHYAGEQDNTLRFLLDRVEFVRSELLYEFKYGADTSPRTHLAAEARIIDRDKLERTRDDGLRLNVGCGHIPLEEYVNVDRRELPGVDIVAEADRIPLETGSVSELASAHLIEHFPQEEFRRKILPHWKALLKDGGTLRAVTPDADAMTRGLADRSYAFEDFRDVLFGAQDYVGDFHFNIFTPESCARLLEEEGFRDVRVLHRGRRNGRCFEFEIVARKVATVSAPQSMARAESAEGAMA